MNAMYAYAVWFIGHEPNHIGYSDQWNEHSDRLPRICQQYILGLASCHSCVPSLTFQLNTSFTQSLVLLLLGTFGSTVSSPSEIYMG